MKNLKLKKMVVIMMLIMIISAVSTNVLATGGLVIDRDQEQINILTNETTDTPAPVTPTTNTDQSQNSLPQTGDASDYAVFILIGLCIVFSIYAYKKVKEYNKF